MGRHAMNVTLFSQDEAAALNAARRSVTAPWTVVYCVWENQYAKSGGIGAVARQLPPEFAAAGCNVIVVSPWHSGLATAIPESEFEGAEIVRKAQVRVPFGAGDVPVRILERWELGVRRVYLSAEHHFEADGGVEGKDPYIYSHDPCATLDDCSLLRDSLLACAAVPHVLHELDFTANLIIHAQDWQFASVALTVKLAVLARTLRSAAVVITSHNPYDHQLSPEMLGLLTDRSAPANWAVDGQPIADSVYAHMLPLADAPVSTVSPAFARELLTDPLLTGHFAPHLQGIYRKLGVVGISNGRFGTAPRTEIPKLQKRRAMLAALENLEDSRAFGRLNGPLDDSIPVFFMFGRFDPGQKGFDVLARAIAAVPAGMARFILAPQVRDRVAAPGDRLFVEDLARLAERRPGDVVVYPFQMDAGVYGQIMGGATFAVMPSMYEPFGAATEPYLAGTPVIARATGGLIEQVTDMSTGILYRESTTLESDVPAEWASIAKSNDPAARMAIPQYGAMVAALAAALVRGAVIYSLSPEVYRGMLENLPAKAAEFDWNIAASRYLEWFGDAVR